MRTINGGPLYITAEEKEIFTCPFPFLSPQENKGDYIASTAELEQCVKIFGKDLTVRLTKILCCKAIRLKDNQLFERLYPILKELIAGPYDKFSDVFHLALDTAILPDENSIVPSLSHLMLEGGITEPFNAALERLIARQIKTETPEGLYSIKWLLKQCGDQLPLYNIEKLLTLCLPESSQEGSATIFKLILHSTAWQLASTKVHYSRQNIYTKALEVLINKHDCRYFEALFHPSSLKLPLTEKEKITICAMLKDNRKPLPYSYNCDRLMSYIKRAPLLNQECGTIRSI